MKHLELQGKKRITGKKADVKNVRNEQRVPCVIYGAGVENTSFSVDEKELNRCLAGIQQRVRKEAELQEENRALREQVEKSEWILKQN